MEVAAAEAGRSDSDNGLAGARYRVGELANLGLAVPDEDNSAHDSL